MGDSIGRPLPGPEAQRVDGGALIGRILGEQGVRYCFTVNGGHIWPILSHLREHGVKLIHMRHEQSVRLRGRRLGAQRPARRACSPSPPGAVSPTP